MLPLSRFFFFIVSESVNDSIDCHPHVFDSVIILFVILLSVMTFPNTIDGVEINRCER